MRDYVRPQHVVIGRALSMMDRAFLTANRCWFGGGTAIIMKLGEYRQSLDIDFLCADDDGYRELRIAAVEAGVRAFFPEPVTALRDMRVDQYGLRSVVELEGQLIKFEVVREGRIPLEGHYDQDLGVPALVDRDMFAEKLLANADGCQDRVVAYRDAIDLGMMVDAFGGIPSAAVDKSQAAYGADIGRRIAWVISRLEDAQELRHAAEVLQMELTLAVRAISALRAEAGHLWRAEGSRAREARKVRQIGITSAYPLSEAACAAEAAIACRSLSVRSW